MGNILITGASGFTGRRLVTRLAADGHDLVCAQRSGAAPAGRTVLVPHIDGRTDWSDALQGCRVVVHLAAQLPGRGISTQDYERTNADATGNLAGQAATAGVRLFIYLSSIGAVSGHASAVPVGDDFPPVGASAYGRSKLVGEGHVARFATDGRCGICLRPPMLYGPGAKGNWHQLLRLAASGLPLPFAAVHNRRHMMAVDNLVDAIGHLVAVAPAGSQSGAYGVSDAEVIGLGEIIAEVRSAMGLPERLFTVPPVLLRGALKLLGRGALADSLLSDLEIDSSRFRDEFGWRPVVHVKESIRNSAEKFRS